MEPMTMGILAGGMAAGMLGSSMIGSNAAKKESARAAAEAARLRQQALAELSQMSPIELSALGYNPMQIEEIKAAEPLLYSQMPDVQANLVQETPETRQMQMQALSDLLQRSEEGLSAQDKYNFMKNRRDAETASRGQEMAIQENLRQRGMGGTGIEAALRMMAVQGGADRLAEQQAMEAANNAQMRLNATQQYGNMAGQVRGQDIGVAKSNADILNQLAWNNSERARQIANMNIDMRNKAAQDNILNQRNIEQANVNNYNQAQLFNKQQQIENEKIRQESQNAIRQSKANAQLGGISEAYAGGAANAARAQQLWGTIGQIFPAAANIYMAGQNSPAQSSNNQGNVNNQPYNNFSGVGDDSEHKIRYQKFDKNGNAVGYWN